MRDLLEGGDTEGQGRSGSPVDARWFLARLRRTNPDAAPAASARRLRKVHASTPLDPLLELFPGEINLPGAGSLRPPHDTATANPQLAELAAVLRGYLENNVTVADSPLRLPCLHHVVCHVRNLDGSVATDLL
jgi:hypothetical protein